MDLDEKIRKLREREAAAIGRKAQAEHELAFAQGREQTALLALKTEFGAESTEAAQALLKETEDDLAAECRRLEIALAQVRGPE